jgi:hypothetical protein
VPLIRPVVSPSEFHQSFAEWIPHQIHTIPQCVLLCFTSAHAQHGLPARGGDHPQVLRDCKADRFSGTPPGAAPFGEDCP